MCGIAGVVGSQLNRDQLELVLAKLERELHHRGPDDQGHWISRNGNVGLVNTRLAIIDLTTAGHQPMSTPDGRYHIVYNGEIYNYSELRAQLSKAESGKRKAEIGEPNAEGPISESGQYPFRSHSDTEVILALYAAEGAKCVHRLEGMFAFAIWDEAEQSLFVARDPLGIKPLYYSDRAGQFCFASELRPLIKTDLVATELSAQGIAGYLLYGTVPEPFTLLRDVRVLPAGHYLNWKKGKAISITQYWDVRFGSERMSNEQAVKVVRGALEESVERHFVSDVPVGVFLSGGIDSTAVVALAARHHGDLRTFSLSFDESEFNEGDVAARTANHFHTRHTDCRLDAETAKALLQEFLVRSDQPSIDGFNTFCVAKLARDHGLKVVLSGLGGDELFGGYRSFSVLPKLIHISRYLNPISAMRARMGRLMESGGGSPKRNRLAQFLRSDPTPGAAHWAMRGIFTPNEVSQLLPNYGADHANGELDLEAHSPAQPTVKDQISYLETTRYMRNQLLRDSDVMSMSWSLELRVPFADQKLLDTVAQLPAAQRLAQGKRILLDAISEIPEWVRNRPKQGFTFPFKNWVTGQWRDIFRQIEDRSPVPLKSWYRTWCLFALDNFLDRNGIGHGCAKR